MSSSDHGDWSLAEIARGTGMHASTLHRLLAVLEGEQLIRKDQDSGRYALGLEFLRLAWKAASRENLVDIALPVLRELTEQTRETSALGIYDPTRQKMMFIASIESPHPIRHSRPLYEWMPVHGGATGRAILAFLPESERASVLAGPLAPMTEHTITAPAELAANLENVRRNGYAISFGERTAGGVGIGSPIFGPTGRPIGVIGVTLPAQRFDPADEPKLATLVQRAAERVGAALGGAVHS